MKKIYLDSCMVIYLIEDNCSFSAQVMQAFEQAAQQNAQFCVTDLTRLECRLHPIKQQNFEILEDYDAFFTDAVHHLQPCSRLVFDQATQLRAQYGLKTPDALHLAAAIQAQCHEFWTNDQRLQQAAACHLRVVNICQQALNSP